MLYYKNRLIFGGIKKIITAIMSFIYKLLKYFNLQIALFVVLVGIILFFAGVFENSYVAEMIFYLILVLSLFYSVAATLRKILFPTPKIKNKKRAKIGFVKNNDQSIDPQENKQENIIIDASKQQTVNQSSIMAEVPKYYKVKQNPQYVMAEYSDRYELYYKTGQGLKKVRTDYKENVR